MAVRRHWRRVDGVLLLDKSCGMSSNAALQAARRLFGAARAGHTGTLDPLASGLLPLCFGEATKFSSDLLGADKSYQADVCFGVRTDTGDAEGTVLSCQTVSLLPAEVDAALGRFRGPITQVPPMYSALKRDGRPLYELARRGITVDREARRVCIHELRLLAFAGDSCRLYVSCSKGTYVRSLAVDLGEALGCGAHVSALRRVAVGALGVADAWTIERIAALPEERRHDCLLAADILVQTLPAVDLDEAEGRRFAHGNPVPATGTGGRKRVYSVGRFLGVGELDPFGKLHPRRVVDSSLPSAGD